MPNWVLNQLVRPFIWGSRIETVSHNTCFLGQHSGGINLCNLKLKAEALNLASLVGTIDSPEDSAFFLAKYFVGRRLSTIRKQWAGLRDNSAPSAASATPCLRTLAKMDEKMDLTFKKIYAKLLAEFYTGIKTAKEPTSYGENQKFPYHSTSARATI